ncbi:MAG: hypothetical protein L6W00_14640 [Lentisphaeria bacterium]|nr:MAG: hypothetical protein L6W00_14640 [Lentisphaeria bacterium]
MKSLNKNATIIIQKLLACINNPKYARTMGKYAKINNSNYSPVSVEKLMDIPTFDTHFVISHTTVLNGDLMRDPEMEFVTQNGKYYPITYRQDYLGIMQEALIYTNDGTPIKYRPDLMRDLAEFANEWMLNIEQQQHIIKECK